ncbi:MAG: hypothetical protein RL557_843 [archaeon]|jgi:ABC transporter with metal-binding/Fe-S-binding domain ATP-binding protein
MGEQMKIGILFSGGKDSMYACWTAKKMGHDIGCLISIYSENEDSFMFHTPSIQQVEKQAEVMNIPLLTRKTRGEKETELDDLEKIIREAIQKYRIEGIVTGAIKSVYQASRVQKICNAFGIECFNPLWQKNQGEHLQDLIKNKFEVVITGVAAFPFDKKFLGRKIDSTFISEMKSLEKKYGVNPAGEGGEFESFVLDCPLFLRRLKVISYRDFGERHSWRREVEVR